MTEPGPLHRVDGTHVLLSGRTLSYFSGCDYFRLSSHSKVRQALVSGLKHHGFSVSASRMTTGNHVLYGELERQLARFFRQEAALLVSTGYVTNLVAAQALCGRFSHAVIDKAAHPSLKDAAEMLGCPVLSFDHKSMADLKSVLRRCGTKAKIVLLTEGMIASDGSVAPLNEYRHALPRDGLMLVDDAHGSGVLGKEGRGAMEYTRTDPNRVIQTTTLSKAFGVYGGVILGPKEFRERILAKSRLFVGSTPLPLPLVSAALRSLKLIAAGKSLRARLAKNAKSFRGILQRHGMAVPETPGPIVALQPRDATATLEINRALLKAGIYPPFIQYPGGPAAGYFRFVISSEHTRTQLTTLARALLPILNSMKPF